jgi:hypothetical protein
VGGWVESVHVGALPLVDLGEGDHLAVKRSTELCSGRWERGEGVEQAGAQSDAPHKEPELGSPATQWLEPRPTRRGEGAGGFWWGFCWMAQVASVD